MFREILSVVLVNMRIDYRGVYIMKKLLLVFVCIFLSNCSYAALHKYEDKSFRRCSALYYTAPVLDTSVSVLSLMVLIVLPSAIALSSHSSSSNGDAKQILGTSVISTVAFGSSAIYGYNKVYECRNK